MSMPSGSLTVNDVGAITMPLREEQAQLIISRARQAPYGRGEETVVDTSVRNTWELDSSEFELVGEKWDELMEVMLARVGKGLGITSPIKAELYKMLLYEKGALFNSHTDSPKIPNMFGTLVVILPSAHMGGEVVLRHSRHKEMIFKSSRIPQGFMSWYSDVHHEVLPVTQGYRWVLTYNLALADPSLEHPSADNTLHSRNVSLLLRPLKSWLSGRLMGCPVYKLDHHYSMACLSLAGLKGRDKAVIHALEDVASQFPLRVFLAILERQDQGSCYGSYGRGYNKYQGPDSDEIHEIDSINSTDYKFHKLVDLGGYTLAEDVLMDEGDMLAEYDFGEGHVEEIEYEEGYSGNEGGPTATHAYRVSGLVIVPQSRQRHFMIRAMSSGNTDSLLFYFANKSQDPSQDQEDFKLLRGLCEHAWQNTYWGPNRIGPGASRAVLEAAFRMQDEHFLKRAAGHVQQSFNGEFCKWVMEHRSASFPFARLKDPLQKGILSLSELSQVMSALDGVTVPKAPHVVESSDDVNEWALQTLNALLDILDSKFLDSTGGSHLAMVLTSCYDANYFQTRILPVLLKQTKKVGFGLGFLEQVANKCRSDSDHGDDWLRVYENLATPLIQNIDVSQLFNCKSAPRPAVTFPYTSPHYDSRSKLEFMASNIDSPNLVVLYADLTRLQLGQNLAALLSRNISQNAAHIKSAEFMPLWMPFLRELLPVLEQSAASLSAPLHQQVYVSILTAFLVNYVGKEVPKVNRDLVRPEVPCSCGDCRTLNVFLASTDNVGRFSINKQRRQHLHQQLERNHIDCTHTTERYGSPQTLVVVKTFTKHARVYRDWRLRHSEANLFFKEFPNQQLRELLGVNYSRIFYMEDILAKTQTTNELPSALSSLEGCENLSLLFGPQTGQKRKADDALEVVDLTGLE